MVKDAGFDRPAGGAAFDVSIVPRAPSSTSCALMLIAEICCGE
jgi:hypothetical protein